MLEARIIKSSILQDDKTGGTVLFGVAEYFDDRVNFKVPYDWDNFDRSEFIHALRDKLAEDFELPTYRVDIQESELLYKMKQYAEWNKQTSRIIL